MKNVVLFWNHICILHGFEKQYLEKLKNTLRSYDINLIIKYFGVGYSSYMSQYILEGNLPDIIVSSDLEVFENAKIFNKLGKLHNCQNWIQLKNTPVVKAVNINSNLLPFVIIPMVLYANRDFSDCGILEVFNNFKVSFGGINNSAAKTVIKSIWHKFGKSSAEKLMKNSLITDMPINSFQSTKLNSTDCSIVPSLYALSADNKTKYISVSKDGPVLLPSYFAVRDTICEDTAKLIVENLFNPTLLDFYSKNGDLINCTDISKITSSQEYSEVQLFYTKQFIENLDSEMFYDLYLKYLPSAKRL